MEPYTVTGKGQAVVQTPQWLSLPKGTTPLWEKTCALINHCIVFILLAQYHPSKQLGET